MICDNKYSLLTIEVLLELEKKVDALRTTQKDCEFIDHYLTSIGKPPGRLLEMFLEDDVESFAEAEKLIKDERRGAGDDEEGLRAFAVTGLLLGCILNLQGRVENGELIY